MLGLRFQQLERSIPRGLTRYGLVRCILPSDRCATRRPLSTITTINSNSVGDQLGLLGLLPKSSITSVLGNRERDAELSSRLQGRLTQCFPSSVVTPVTHAEVSTVGTSISTNVVHEEVGDSNMQGQPSMELDSVLRKRRKKMKKHKLRKRRRRERAEKRKLSQGR